MGRWRRRRQPSPPTETVAAAPEAKPATVAMRSKRARSGRRSTALRGAAAEDAPPPPKPVLAAYKSDKTVVLLFVRDGGIDDRLVENATRASAPCPTSTFIVPADQIARYAAITEGVGVDRVPALVVVRAKNLNGDTPRSPRSATASKSRERRSGRDRRWIRRTNPRLPPIGRWSTGLRDPSATGSGLG